MKTLKGTLKVLLALGVYVVVQAGWGIVFFTILLVCVGLFFFGPALLFAR